MYTPPHMSTSPSPFVVLIPDQNQAHAARFLVLQAKTAPRIDLSIPSSNHLNHRVHPTPHVITSLPVRLFNPRPKPSPRGLVFGFTGQNRPPGSISPSRPSTTSTTVYTPPRMSPPASPFIVLIPDQNQAHAARFSVSQAKTAPPDQFLHPGLQPPQPLCIPHPACPHQPPRSSFLCRTSSKVTQHISVCCR